MNGDSPLPDPSTPFGDLVHRRLREELVVWLTTIGGDGTPQPNPVWFLWEGESCLVYNVPSAMRLRHVRRQPAVSLHFDRGDSGTIVFAGRAAIADDQPPADHVPAFLAKYGHRMESTEAWARRFSVPVRIRLLRTRGHHPQVGTTR